MVTIGIDLGTSNSLVGYWIDQKPVLIKNEFDNVLTPSVISLDDNDELLIGEIARERLMTHPDKTVAAFKRFMGTEKVYQLGNKTFTPIELSAILLRKLKENAERFLGDSCLDAVISVPAYFNNLQREATIESAQLAGLNVKSLISEPTAAAVSYGLQRNEEDSRILVIDLGGGTFDVSLLEMFEGIMQVEAISGDNFLGGEDFTQVIVKDFLSKNSLDESKLTAEQLSIIYRKADTLKKELSSVAKKSFEIVINEIIYTYELDEIGFAKISEPLLKRLRLPIIRVLKDAHVDLTEIKHIIMIGGATRTAMIRKYLSKFVGKLLFTQINPDEAVGLGAVIQSELQVNQEMLQEFILTDVCAHTVGIGIFNENAQVEGELFSPIIERNTSIPVSKVKTFQTVYDNQPCINVEIYQGEHRLVKDNLKLGNLEVKLPKMPKDELIDIRFTYDYDGILEVLVEIQKSKKVRRLVIENSSGKLSQSEIDSRFKKLENLKIHPIERSEVRLLLARGERLYAESLGDARDHVTYLISKFQAQLNRQDEKLTKIAMKEFAQAIDRLEEDFSL